MFDDFITQIQSDEKIHKEYEDWLYFYTEIYEKAKYDHFREDKNV